MKNKLFQYRIPVLASFIGITLLALLLLPRIEVNPNLDKYIPDNVKNKIYLKELDSIFGGNEMIIIMLHADNVMNTSTLERLEVLSKELSQLDGINRCVTPFDAQDISVEDGFMNMEPLLSEVPDDKEEFELLKAKVLDNGMARHFFDDNFTVVSLIITKDTEASDKDLIDEIKTIIENNPGPEEVLMGGLPFIRYSISSNIRGDLMILLPIALFLMVILLFFSFREWKGVFMPFIIVIMSTILSFGFMALLGWKISLITILLPIILIAIANDYGIHMIARYQELARSQQSLSMMQICKQIYKDLKRPIIVTGLTTIGGILGLLTHTMIPAAQLGILAAIGIGFALLLSIWFLPVLLSFFKPIEKVTKRKSNKQPLADRWLNRFSRLVTHFPKRVVIISSVIGVLGIIGILFLEVDTNIESYFLGKSEVSRGTKLINDNLGGSQYISILFTGDVLSPELLLRMEAYEKEILENPAVGHINSPVTLVKELSKGFYDSDETGYFKIPQSADEIYQLLEVYTMGGNEEDFEQFLDYNYENSRMLISLKDGSNKVGKDILKDLQELTKDDQNVKFIAGTMFTAIELADMVVSGQIKSLIFAILVVFILLSIIFKSVRAGVISSLPLSIAIFTLFGLMGYLGISLDIATALLSSIMIGVGIDYTIHFLWRFKEERANGHKHEMAAHITLCTTGRGIIFNAFSVMIGFLALTLSNFAPLRFFGALVVISISTCLISALILIPSIVILVKPKFLETKK